VSWADRFRIFHHRAKFVDCEQLAILADSLLAKNDRAGRREANRKRNDS
jgi:hypothetical protein